MESLTVRIHTTFDLMILIDDFMDLLPIAHDWSGISGRVEVLGERSLNVAQVCAVVYECMSI